MHLATVACKIRAHGFKRLGSASAHGNRRARLREPQCDGAPDAPAATADDNSCPFEIGLHLGVPLFDR
jgi:hypothetical protein